MEKKLARLLINEIYKEHGRDKDFSGMETICKSHIKYLIAVMII